MKKFFLAAAAAGFAIAATAAGAQMREDATIGDLNEQFQADTQQFYTDETMAEVRPFEENLPGFQGLSEEQRQAILERCERYAETEPGEDMDLTTSSTTAGGPLPAAVVSFCEQYDQFSSM